MHNERNIMYYELIKLFIYPRILICAEQKNNSYTIPLVGLLCCFILEILKMAFKIIANWNFMVGMIKTLVNEKQNDQFDTLNLWFFVIKKKMFNLTSYFVSEP